MTPRGRRQSVTSKIVGLARANAVKAALPKCGARNKRGGVCQNTGTGAGGRCPMHGGKTPSGKNWHVAVLPANGPRLERKLAALAKRREKRAAEIAAMSPERRAQYDQWCRTHKPGRPADRETARRDREAWQWLVQPAPPVAPDPKTEALLDLRAELRDQAARLEALLEGKNPTEDENKR